MYRVMLHIWWIGGCRGANIKIQRFFSFASASANFFFKTYWSFRAANRLIVASPWRKSPIMTISVFVIGSMAVTRTERLLTRRSSNKTSIVLGDDFLMATNQYPFFFLRQGNEYSARLLFER